MLHKLFACLQHTVQGVSLFSDSCCHITPEGCKTILPCQRLAYCLFSIVSILPLPVFSIHDLSLTLSATCCCIDAGVGCEQDVCFALSAYKLLHL